MIIFLELLTAITISFILGMFVFLKRPKNPVNITFLFTCICIMFCGLEILCLFTIKNRHLAEYSGNIFRTGLILLPVAYIHFIMSITNFTNLTFLLLNYLTCCFFISLNWSPYLISNFYYNEIGKHYYFKAGPLYSFFIFYFILTFVAGFMIMLKKYRECKSIKTQNQILHLLLGIILGISITSINFPAMFGFYKYNIVAFIAGFTIYLCIAAYTITKHNLMDMRTAINRFMAFIILSIIYAFAGYLLFLIFSQFFIVGNNLSTFIFLSTLLIFAGFFFHPLRLHLQTTPDKFLFRKKYLYEQTISEFAKETTGNLTVAEAVELFKRKVKNAVKAKHVDVSIFQERRE